ncbi:MAG: MraY family glycosyltransferase [Cyanobacteria bacterium P01_E01_bin.6]
MPLLPDIGFSLLSSSPLFESRPSISLWILLAPLCSLGIVLLTIPAINRTAQRYNQVDRPSTRKVHQRPIVRLGGIAIAVGTLAGFGMAAWSQSLLLTELPTPMWGILLGSTSFFLIGLSDDLINLSAFHRLWMQSAIAIMVWGLGVRIDFVSIPNIGIVQLEWLSLPITILWLTGVVNAINWTDGLDGLAAGVSGIAATVMLIIGIQTHQPFMVIILLPLIGSLIGFLYYNFNPATIFMGDGGSYLIGFLLASVSILGLAKTATVTAIALPALVLAVPLVDMSAVIATRLLHGQSPFRADQRHLHHRLLSAGIPHRLTVLLIYALTAWASSFALLLINRPIGVITLAIATICLLGLTWQAYQHRCPA